MSQHKACPPYTAVNLEIEMNDRDFLMWIHERLENVHGENPHYDYMHKLREIIKHTPTERATANTETENNLNALKKELGITPEPETEPNAN
jgi:uncharacterized protein YprB with RNaseH-like and TPR domain